MAEDHISTGGASVAPLTLCTDDGCPIAATRYRARAERRGVMLVAPATLVHKGYYAAFAEYFATLGWDVLVWDWRGVADSRFGLSDCDRRLTMRNWGVGDLSAAIAWADRRADGEPVVLVGHSFGGQAVALATNASRLDAVILVGAQHGWFGNWPFKWRLLLAPFWFVVMPLVTRVLGYFPGDRFGMRGRLPRGVALEWARWCRRREHHGEWGNLANVRAPVLAISASDDHIAPRRAVERLLEEFRGSSRKVHRHLEPRAVGVGRIGHFGFFRDGGVPGLWQECARFLEEVAAQPPLGSAAS